MAAVFLAIGEFSFRPMGNYGSAKRLMVAHGSDRFFPVMIPSECKIWWILMLKKVCKIVAAVGGWVPVRFVLPMLSQMENSIPKGSAETVAAKGKN
jgi:hypothetical protein